VPRKRQKKAKEEESAAAAEPKHITPVEIQQKEFRVAMRGYHEQDVDQFLDDVTEEVARLHAENRRLREELEFARTRGLDASGANQAEAILRNAREEADRLVAEARARAAAQPSGTPSPGTASSHPAAGDLTPFIVREREFLQSLADLIQAHAEAVKEQLRRAREAAAPADQGVSAPSRAPSAHTSSQPWTMAPEPHEPDETAPHDVRKSAPPQAGPSVTSGEASFQDRAEPEIEGQDWTQYYSGPVAPPGGFMASHDDEDILDLTESPRSGDGDEEDRSLRELFWGED
jgi:DivIVA domain-containing protein